MALISDDTRLAIIDLKRCGWSIRRISRTLEVGLATVKRTLADDRRGARDHADADAALVSMLDDD